MKEKKLRITTFLIAGCLLFPLTSTKSNAACSRSDVDYYLEKGFSHEQIADICGGAVQKEPKLQLAPSNKSSEAAPKPQVQTRGGYFYSSPEKFLAESISGYDIAITGDAIKYTRKMCLEYGEEDMFGFKDKVCPQVLYSINLKGLKVLETQKEYIVFGEERVRVEGKISRRIIDNSLNDLQEDERKLIMDIIQEEGNQTAIPIREGVPLYRVVNNLKKLSR